MRRLPHLALLLLVSAAPSAEAAKTKARAQKERPALPAWSPPSTPLLQPGDKVVILGDSITVAHTWTRNVESYFRLRHPDISLVFINAGIGGHTAQDGLNRLQRDVLAHKPSVVLVNFGMNDAGYPAGTDGGAFERNMEEIHRRLEAAGVRLVAWIEPTPCELEGAGKRSGVRARDERLAAWGPHVLGQPKRTGRVVVPWRVPVLDAMASWRAATGNPLIPDRIHPSAPAHGVMAAKVLQGLGYPVATPAVTSRVEKGQLRTRVAAGVAEVSVPFDGNAPVKVDLRRAVPPLLFTQGPEEAKNLGSAEVSALRALPWKVTGLPEGRSYRVLLGTEQVGVFSSAELAEGVDLMAQAQRVKPPAVNPTMGTTDVAQGPDALMEQCADGPGNPFTRDFDCAFRLLFQKDQLRLALRPERTYGFPAFVPEYREEFNALAGRWIEATDTELAVKLAAFRDRPHLLQLVPVGQ
jgi:lysophospholipase L1-like esterase